MITAIIIGFLSILVPGFFLSLALLRKTKMGLFQITMMGFIFGLIFPPAFVWGESYLIPVSSAFSFSSALYGANVIFLTILGILLCIWQGAITKEDLSFNFISKSKKSTSTVQITSSDHKARVEEIREKLKSLNIDLSVVKIHEQEERELESKHKEEIRLLKEKGAGSEELEIVTESHTEQEKRLYRQHENEEKDLLSYSNNIQVNKSTSFLSNKRSLIIWSLLFLIILATFATRISNIGVAPKFFEFDPYFDMVSTQYILTYGYQPLYEHAAWPTLVNGTVHRIQPLVPYLEAYWYELATTNTQKLNNTLLSDVSSFYPPIVAALLVFVIFLFIYTEYGDIPALFAAGLTFLMPTLISTFIAGEQLLEPWGIFTLFFFFATYLLAVKYPEQKRYAILAGIAFASTFLGAHYYTVDAGILAFYIVAQGIIDVFKGKITIDFYKMNIVVIAVITLFYIIYAPYGASLTNRIPSLLGIPTIVAFPLFALVIVFLYDYLPKFAKEKKYIKNTGRMLYLEWLILLIIIVILLIVFTPLGKPVIDYLQLSQKFTTPSSPLFMTVQEYAPTGLTFNFGSNGFGSIGASILGFPMFLFIILIIFAIIEIYSVFATNSKSAMLAIAIVAVLAVAGLSEVKYLPHFGVAYILAIGVILGTLFIYLNENKNKTTNLNSLIFIMETLFLIFALASIIASITLVIGAIVSVVIGVLVAYLINRYYSRNKLYYMLYLILIIALISESSAVFQIMAALGSTCTQIFNSNNVMGANLFCNSVPQQWLSAMAWAASNVGPRGPRILSWWDYGDWINWFGNSNAVIRGDNSVASFDYRVAANYILSPNDSYGPVKLAQLMQTTQTGYVLFDDQLVPKWGALDFLGCVYANETSKAYAVAQGSKYGLSTFLTGTSQCEISHDPIEVNIPSNPTVSDYCNFKNSSIQAVQVLLTVGQTVPQAINQSYCVPTTGSSNGVLPLYTVNGTRTNIIIDLNNTDLVNGYVNYGSAGTFFSAMAIYLPNGPNYTVTDAPSLFYSSNYYRGFFLGHLPGFTMVYPVNGFSGINLINSTNDVIIYKLNNYSDGVPPYIQKPSYITNNFSVPG
ncbi:MAG: hypothetical protein ACP5M9_03400 [Candidatus Micrarchaeia archaeon]